MTDDLTKARDGAEMLRLVIDNAPLAAAETWQQAVVRLAALPPIEYDRVRIAEAERHGARVGTLDAEVERARPAEAAAPAGQGAAVEFFAPEPWPAPVDGAELLAAIANEVQRYVVLRPEAADAVALWIMHAHAHGASEISPVLAVTSPEKRCGKTTLLGIIERLVPRALSTANVTAAALFRCVEKWQPTLLIDEADTFLRDNEDLRGVLNSGHNRSSASILRTVGDDHEPRRFATWAPKAIAAIGKLPSTLADRAVEVALQRKRPGDRCARFRARQDTALADLHRQAVRWAADHAEALTGADPSVPDALHDRAADNWRTLVAIADRAAGEWPERARRAALALSVADAAGVASIGEMLLADVQAIFAERGASRIASEDLARALGEMEHRPWPEWKMGRPITARQVARLLAPFGVRPSVCRVGTQVFKGYDLADFVDAFNRYTTPSAAEGGNRSVTTVTSNDFNDLGTKRSVTRGSDVTDRNAANPLMQKECNRVTDRLPESGAGGGVADPEQEHGAFDGPPCADDFGPWWEGPR